MNSRHATAAAALVTGLSGLAFVFMGLHADTTSRVPSPLAVSAEAPGSASAPPARARGQRHQDRRHHAGVEDLITGPVLPPAAPVSVTIPRLHISSPLLSLGIGSGGAMDVPTDPALAGWYRLGPPPGALGPAVIAGHVTWNLVPAVFFRLSELRPGDVVQVVRADDLVAVFEVTEVRRYKKSQFPTSTVFGGIDYAGLRLVTCGGQYESAAHRYSDNVVAFARLTSSHPLHPDGEHSQHQ